MHFETKSSLLEQDFLINHKARVTVIDMACTSFCLPKVIDVGLGRSGGDGEVADEVRFLAEKAGAVLRLLPSSPLFGFPPLSPQAVLRGFRGMATATGSSPNFTHGTLLPALTFT